MDREVLFLGDVYLPKNYQGCEEIEYDYVFNFEYPITQSENALPGKINLKSDAYYVKSTFGRHPLAVCLANNHIVDYGDEGVADTISVLKKEGILFFGAGTKAENYNNPLVMEQYGVALLGYCGTRDVQKLAEFGLDNRPAPMELALIRKDIEAALANNHRPIVQLHWGVEESAWPSPENVDFARKVVDCGAEMVIFHHAHTVQPVEYYKGKLIAYCLGNYLFDDLVVPRQFDGEGRPLSYYKKKQRRWNRESIGVLVDMRDFKARILGFQFRNGVVHRRRLGGAMEAGAGQLDDAGALTEKVRKSLRRRFLFHRARNIMSNPAFYLYKRVARLFSAANKR